MKTGSFQYEQSLASYAMPSGDLDQWLMLPQPHNSVPSAKIGAGGGKIQDYLM